MKQMLDVLFLKDTGHVLSAVVRAGEAAGPQADALAGEEPFYPLVPDAQEPVIEVPIPEDVLLDRLSIALTDDKATVLFQRADYQVDSGDLVTGLGNANLSRTNAGVITVAIAAVSTPTPYVVVGVRDGGGEPKLHTGEIPQATASFDLPESFSKAQFSTVVVFAKGFAPEAV
jgi:hypothetical protein